VRRRRILDVASVMEAKGIRISTELLRQARFVQRKLT
jgi:hypothetical protein